MAKKKYLFIIILSVFTQICLGNNQKIIIEKLKKIDSKVENRKEIFVDYDGHRKTLPEAQKDVEVLESAVNELNSIELADSISSDINELYNLLLVEYHLILIERYFSIGDFVSVIESHKIYYQHEKEINRIYLRVFLSQYLANKISIEEFEELLNQFDKEDWYYEHDYFLSFAYLVEKDYQKFSSVMDKPVDPKEVQELRKLLISHKNVGKKEFGKAIKCWESIEEILKQSAWSLWDDLFILEEEYIINELVNSQNEFLVCLLLKYVDEYDRSIEYFDKYVKKYNLTLRDKFQSYISNKYKEEVAHELIEYYNSIPK